MCQVWVSPCGADLNSVRKGFVVNGYFHDVHATIIPGVISANRNHNWVRLMNTFYLLVACIAPSSTMKATSRDEDLCSMIQVLESNIILSIDHSVWDSVGYHQPIAPKELICSWHWAFYVLNYGV